MDIGVHQDGLVRIAQLPEQFVKYPHTVVKASDLVKVEVLAVDPAAQAHRAHHPFWSSPTGAQALATADWADCQPGRVGLAELRGVWFPGMAKAGRRLTLAPSADREGIVCDPGELLADLG